MLVRLQLAELDSTQEEEELLEVCYQIVGKFAASSLV
jgi:hypothetical protein